MEIFQTILISVDTLIRWFKCLHISVVFLLYQCFFRSIDIPVGNLFST